MRHRPRLRQPRLIRSLTLGLALMIGHALHAQAGERSFWAEGSDTGAGLGARYIALGGLGATLADDAYAAFYNPAGLVDVQGLNLAVSTQVNHRFHPVNFLAAAWRLPLAQGTGHRITVAAAYYPRVHARASGAFEESEFESVFLRYLLPGMSGTFNGDIDSKTKSYRLAAAWSPASSSPWSAGAYLEYIDCKSNFCGVHAESKGYTIQSAGAKAIGFGFGLRYAPAPEWTLALQVNDVRTRLTVKTETKGDAGVTSNQTQAAFPTRWNLEAAHQWNSRLRLAAALDSMQGRYGSSQLVIRALRMGAEWQDGPWRYRAGLVAPLRLYSSTSGRLKTPFPAAPSIGLGWSNGTLQLDAALYAHPVMSMHKDRASPSMDLSASVNF